MVPGSARVSMLPDLCGLVHRWAKDIQIILCVIIWHTHQQRGQIMTIAPFANTIEDYGVSQGGAAPSVLEWLLDARASVPCTIE